MPSHQERRRRNDDDDDLRAKRREVYEKAHEYLKHEDEFVRILAQIAIFHYREP